MKLSSIIPYKFLIKYTCSLIVLIIIGMILDKIEMISNSITLRLVILSIFIVIVTLFLKKDIPKINTNHISKSKIALIIIVSELGYSILRGMIPDEILPQTEIIGLVFRYLYSLIVFYILFKTNKDDKKMNRV